MFDLLTFLEKMLGGLDVPDIGLRASAWLKEKGDEYPDLRSRTDALAAWLAATIAEAEPELDPAQMRDTLWGIASDVVNGTAGISKSSWKGMV